MARPPVPPSRAIVFPTIATSLTPSDEKIPETLYRRIVLPLITKRATRSSLPPAAFDLGEPPKTIPRRVSEMVLRSITASSDAGVAIAPAAVEQVTPETLLPTIRAPRLLLNLIP